jgi:hypothetical protein
MMKRSEFIEKTLNCLFEDYMPPGFEKAKHRIEEKFSVNENQVHQKAWELYEYSEEDRKDIRQKLRVAAQKTAVNEAMQKNSVEFGLLAPEEEDYEIERMFRAHDEEGALHRAIEWAEEKGYDVEEPSGDAESIFDWRFDGRRLTQID